MRAYILLLFILFAGCDNFFEPEPANDPQAIFDNLWQEFSALYGPFEERNVDWDALRSKYRPMVSSSTSEEELYTILTSMLAELDDGHVRLTTPGKEIYHSNRVFREKTDDELFNEALIKDNYLDEGYVDKSSYLYGTIQRDVIYLRLKAIDDQALILDKVLDQFSDSKGLIIDLRHGRGGDFTWAFDAFSRLTNEKRLVFSSKTRNGPDRNDFTHWYDWYLEPEGKFFDKPIFVLTDRYTLSASERAAMALKVLPKATLVGDTTSGGHSTVIGRELQNSWYYSISTQKTRFMDGKSYEGIGVIPEVPLRNSRANMAAGTDDVLQYAVINITR
ncbi:MAG TPA: S41 family peptidase [Chryseosolibacter sp.]